MLKMGGQFPAAEMGNKKNVPRWGSITRKKFNDFSEPAEETADADRRTGNEMKVRIRMFRPRSANVSSQHAQLELEYLFAQIRLQLEFLPFGNDSTTSPSPFVKAGDPPSRGSTLTSGKELQV